MSLQIWLPLNGNLENQGLSNAIITGSNIVYDTGLIGKAKTTGEVTIDKNYQGIVGSMAMWIYTSPNGDTTRIFGNDSSGTKNRKWTIHRYPTRNDLHSWGCCEDSNTTNPSNTGSFTITGALPDNKWTHVVYAHNSVNGFIYINGELRQTTTWNSSGKTYTFLDSVPLLSENGGNKICDFRMYDHCLSAKEVKELAKGLVLHYRLAGPGQENIIEHSYNGNGWSIGSGWTSFTDGNGTKGYRFTRTGATSNNWVRIVPPTKINPNDYPEGITVSIDIKTPNISAINNTCVGALQIYDSTGARCGWYEPGWDLSKVKNNVWTKISYFFTQAALKTIQQSGMTYSYTMFSFQLVQNGDISIKNFKAERGNVRTPWCPNPADSAWTTMGYNNNIEYDCSGYCHNGTKIGTITWDIDSPRYTTSYRFQKPSGVFCQPNLAFSQFTIAFWGKHTETNKMLMGSNGSLTDLNTDWYWYGDNSFKYPGGEYYYSHNAGPVKVNEWCHYAAVYDGTKIQIYRNGINEGSQAKTGILSLNKLSVGNGFSDAYYWENGNVADFRIYTTALSAEDIAELYHSAVIVDNTGKTYAYEYFEG